MKVIEKIKQLSSAEMATLFVSYDDCRGLYVTLDGKGFKEDKNGYQEAINYTERLLESELTDDSFVWQYLKQ